MFNQRKKFTVPNFTKRKKTSAENMHTYLTQRRTDNTQNRESIYRNLLQNAIVRNTECDKNNRILNASYNTWNNPRIYK